MVYQYFSPTCHPLPGIKSKTAIKVPILYADRSSTSIIEFLYIFIVYINIPIIQNWSGTFRYNHIDVPTGGSGGGLRPLAFSLINA